jgi:hypothetical protein
MNKEESFSPLILQKVLVYIFYAVKNINQAGRGGSHL